jgi:hypothetical protein
MRALADSVEFSDHGATVAMAFSLQPVPRIMATSGTIAFIVQDVPDAFRDRARSPVNGSIGWPRTTAHASIA